ncbi:hypothetical protein HDU92_008359 [Lobulomyces angularis]|nr:hypothetical protein HDU92_008359 [Lobulomyces angularis]
MELIPIENEDNFNDASRADIIHSSTKILHHNLKKGSEEKIKVERIKYRNKRNICRQNAWKRKILGIKDLLNDLTEFFALRSSLFVIINIQEHDSLETTVKEHPYLYQFYGKINGHIFNDLLEFFFFVLHYQLLAFVAHVSYLFGTKFGVKFTNLLHAKNFGVGISSVFHLNKLLCYRDLFLNITLFQEQVIKLSYTIWVVVYVWLCLFHYIESNFQPPNSQYYPYRQITLWEAFYYIVITVSTVGYGDIIPTSVAGQVVAVMLVIVLIVTIPRMTARIFDSLLMEKFDGGNMTVLANGTLIPGIAALIINLMHHLTTPISPRKYLTWEQQYDDGMRNRVLKLPLNRSFVGHTFTDIAVEAASSHIILNPGSTYILAADSELIIIAENVFVIKEVCSLVSQVNPVLLINLKTNREFEKTFNNFAPSEQYSDFQNQDPSYYSEFNEEEVYIGTPPMVPANTLSSPTVLKKTNFIMVITGNFDIFRYICALRSAHLSKTDFKPILILCKSVPNE